MSSWRGMTSSKQPTPVRSNFQCGQGDFTLSEKTEQRSSVINQTETLGSSACSERPREYYSRIAGLSVGIASVFSEHVLSHPFVVLRRQCQVNNDGLRYHLTPFTLFPITYNIISHQSIAAFTKGLSSSLMVKGMAVGIESLISEVTPLTKDVNRHSSMKKFGQHLLLKLISSAIVSPFYISCLIETVQSDVASELPGVFDVLREGVYRVIGYNSTNRLLPFWKLVFPCVVFSTLHYIISNLVQHTVLLSIKRNGLEEDRNSLVNIYYPELLSCWTSRFLTDLVLYPLELVIHRLGLQGTRTLVDDMDNGTNVVPIVSRYVSTIDCFRSIIIEEGLSGLYRGLGALMLQYAVQGTVLRMAKFSLLIFSRHADDKEETLPRNKQMMKNRQIIDSRLKDYPVSEREEPDQAIHPVNYGVRYASGSGNFRTGGVIE